MTFSNRSNPTARPTAGGVLCEDTAVRIALTIAVLLIAGIGGAADRVEIIIDDSAAMWGAPGGKHVRIVALREVLAEFALTASRQNDELEIGIRTMGGRNELIDDGACDDTGLIVPVGPVQPTVWRETLGDLFPRGRRPLARSVSAALKDLAESNGRIVIITAGGDECGSDINSVSAELSGREPAIKIRVIGLAIGREDTLAFTGKIPFRNLSDGALSLATLMWAVDLSEDRPGKRKDAVDSQNGDKINPALRSKPPATLAVTPERPIADGSVMVEFWGAPEGAAWVTVASADAPLGAYLVRKPVTGSSGVAELRLPGLTRPLEARLVRETSDGVPELIGRTGFRCAHGTARIDSTEKIENGTPLSLSWEGPNQPGDHITIAPADGSSEDYAACILTESGGPVILAAPIVPGTYDIRYISRLGKILTRSTLEVFEVLATLESPTEISSGEVFEVTWTGPNEPQDYLSVAEPGAANESYLEWALTSEGNPLRIQAPRQTGEFELRYVRAADGEVLARQSVTVVAEAVSLRTPAEVEAGSLFEVEWSGTPGDGDFIVIAKKNAAAGRHFDWSYTATGRRLTLAAPFHPGRYEVRYISGSDAEILARQPLVVR